MPGELGEPAPGDEIWSCDLPLVVHLNRLQETGSIEFMLVGGLTVDATVTFTTATGLIEDLGMKRA